MFLPTPYKVSTLLFGNTILVDCDGVCANFRDTYVQACNKANGTSFKDEDAEPGNRFKDNLKLTSEQAAATWEELRKPGWVEHMSLLPGAFEGVHLLARAGKVVFLTSLVTGTPTWMTERVTWLRRHFSDILYRNKETMEDRIIFATEEGKVGVPGLLFIDDKASTVSKWMKRWGPLGGLGFVATSYARFDWEHVRRVLETGMIVNEISAPLRAEKSEEQPNHDA